MKDTFFKNAICFTSPKSSRAVTLTELIIAVLLLTTVVMTSMSVEMAIRRLSVKPKIQSELVNELIPVVGAIQKDFYQQISTVFNQSPSIEDSNQRLAMLIDRDQDGLVSSGDVWIAYQWDPATREMRFKMDNSSAAYEVIASDISNFNVSVPSGYNTTVLRVSISKRKNSAQAVDPLENPEVSYNATFFSRMTSAH